MAIDKPRHRSGYTADELEQVKATCLTVAVTLGAFMDDIRIVGGLVPALLIDATRGESDVHHDPHPGTNDLDVGLALDAPKPQRHDRLPHPANSRPEATSTTLPPTRTDTSTIYSEPASICIRSSRRGPGLTAVAARLAPQTGTDDGGALDRRRVV